MSALALLGGTPAVEGPLKPFRAIGERERALVNEVIDGGLLSGFYGSWGEEFWGGPMVRRLEALWQEKLGCRHVVSVNSATSGLFAAAGAIGLSPGDEVICPPTTMSATAVAPMFYGAVPVFADIEDQTFCLDPAAVEAAIGPRTKAIFAVNLFGHPARLAELRTLADRRGLYLVEDNAQGPFAMEDGRPAGTIGHIGVFSLNVHKHIQTGEGGLCVTDDDNLALRLQMIRNHGENVVRDVAIGDIANTMGLNFRMTELSAAVGVGQIERAQEIIDGRVAVAEHLSAGLQGIDGFSIPAVRENCRHVYYVWTARYDPAVVGIARETLVKALQAEGIPAAGGYVAPLYRLPMFRERRAIGRDGFPFTGSNQAYGEGLCPVAEALHATGFVTYEICAHDPSPAQRDQLVAGVRKVIAGAQELAAWEAGQA